MIAWFKKVFNWFKEAYQEAQRDEQERWRIEIEHDLEQAKKVKEAQRQRPECCHGCRCPYLKDEFKA